MVPSLPVTPGPALGAPVTGGQYLAHEPVHREAAAVSGANQYRVRPAALVSTVTLPIVVVFKVTAALPATAGAPPARASATPSTASAATETAPTAPNARDTMP